jgi:hypothetical protein
MPRVRTAEERFRTSALCVVPTLKIPLRPLLVLLRILYRCYAELEFPVKDGSESHPTETSIIHWDPGSGGVVGDRNYIHGSRDEANFVGGKMRSFREVATYTYDYQADLGHIDTKIKHNK